MQCEVGYGFYLYDIAGALLELSPDQRMRFIDGYKSVISLEAGYAGQLESFFIMIMIENYCHHCSNPAEIPNLKAEQPYALAYLHAFVHEKPFLFERLAPFA